MRSIGKAIALGILQAAGMISVPGASAISPYLIGENSFNADVPGQDADRTWPKMKEARFRLIRIGGISNNDKTPSAADHARWIDSIRSIGAEPLVQVSSIDPPETAAALVRALNVDRKYAVRFWSIGNEQTCVDKTTPSVTAGIAANAKARALAMRAVDPSIQILFGDECYWKADFYGPLIGGADDVTGNANGARYIDGVTFHTYPLPGADKSTVYTRNDVVSGAVSNLRGQFQKARAAIDSANALHKRTGDAALSLSLTEFNVTYWNSSDNTPAGVGVRSFLAGQFVAEVFGMGMQYGALAVCPWSMMESGGDGGASDLGIFDGTGSVVPRPAYHHIKMIADNMAGAYLSSSLEMADLLRTYASQDQDTVAILILNENQTAGYRFTMKLKAGTGASEPTVYADAGWDGELADSIPAQSTLMLKVRKPGTLMARTFYSLAMAENHQAPTVTGYPVSLGSPSSATFGLHLTSDEIRGRLAAAGPYAVQLSEVNGRVVASGSGVGADWVLPTQGLRPAVYFLTVRTSLGMSGGAVALLGR